MIEDPWGTRLELVQDPDALGLHHVELRVPDPEESFRWYVRAFGGDRTKYKGIDAIRYRDLGVFYLVIVKDDAAAPSQGHAIDHLGFGPIDLDKVVTDLTAHGVTFTSNPNPRGFPACTFRGSRRGQRPRDSPALLRGTRPAGASGRLARRPRRRAHRAGAAPRSRRPLVSDRPPPGVRPLGGQTPAGSDPGEVVQGSDPLTGRLKRIAVGSCSWLGASAACPMLNRIIEVSLNNRVLVVALACALGAWGWWAAGATPIDAIPDLSDNQVIVFTDWPGHSAQEVEDQVRYPLTVNLQGLAGVRVVRSQSAFGFSMIYVVFEDDVDQYFARARVLERLSLVTTLLPEGTAPTLGPDATGVGHVFWYTVDSDRHSLRDLRTHPGLVHPVSAQRRARRGRGRLDRRTRPAVPDRRRSEPAPGLQPLARRRRRRGSPQQPERRRQRARGQRHVVDRPRRRADRVGRGPAADRRQRIGRRARLRAPGGRGARRRRVPRRVAGQGPRRGGRRRGRDAHGRQRAAGDRRRSRRASTRSAPGSRPASASCRSTTARR